MTTRPRLSIRRHLAFISATLSMGLSSIRISTLFNTPAAAAIFSQSVSRREPVTSRVFSTQASELRSRVASCSRDISSENMATVFFSDFATFSATFNAKEVFPIPGRAASRIRSDLFRPLIFRSTADKPVDRPGSRLSLSLISLSRSSTSGSTIRRGTISCALWPRRTA